MPAVKQKAQTRGAHGVRTLPACAAVQLRTPNGVGVTQARHLVSGIGSSALIPSQQTAESR